MSESLAAGSGAAWEGGLSAAPAERWAAPGVRRMLQLALAGLWLLDAVLQYQSFMFTRAFGQMLAATAQGNPAVVAGPITWSARIVAHHPAAANAGFATIQLLLALGIAWRPAARIALAASVAWAVGVWWLGEGLGGVLTGAADPVSGAPGAAILYALLAVLAWPAGHRQGRGRGKLPPSVAGRPFGMLPAKLLWLVLWGSLAWFAVQPASRAPQGLHDMVAQMAAGEPWWLAWTDHGAAGLLAHHGLQASVVLAAVLAVIAAAVFLPTPFARAGLILAVVVAAAIWVAGEDFGGIFTGSATDPNSGPLLALLAAAYWPRAVTVPAPGSGHQPVGRDVALGGQAEAARLTLPAGGTVSGVVRAPGGDPLPGTLVVAAATDGTIAASAVTDSCGSYRLAGLGSGKHVLVAAGHLPATAAVSIGPGATAEVTLRTGPARPPGNRPPEDPGTRGGATA